MKTISFPFDYFRNSNYIKHFKCRMWITSAIFRTYRFQYTVHAYNCNSWWCVPLHTKKHLCIWMKTSLLAWLAFNKELLAPYFFKRIYDPPTILFLSKEHNFQQWLKIEQSKVRTVRRCFSSVITWCIIIIPLWCFSFKLVWSLIIRWMFFWSCGLCDEGCCDIRAVLFQAAFYSLVITL